MNVGLLTHSTNPRGGVVHVLELGRALHARGHDVTIFAPAASGERFFRPTPCRVSLAPVDRRPRGFADGVRHRIEALRWRVGRQLEQRPFDVLHAHDGIGANALADLLQDGRIPGYLRTVHHLDRFADSDVQAWEERSIRRAHRVLCVSNVWRQRLRDEHGVNAHRVCNGVDLQRYAARPDARDAALAARLGLDERSGPCVLTVGGIEARKNTRRVLQAFRRVRERHPGATLVVAGGASLLSHDAEVQAFQHDLVQAGLAVGPGADVVLAGPVADDDMPALYRLADVVAMPSLIEGFGLAALEGLACGTPAVVSSIAPFSEHFASGDVEWADPNEPESIACALERAIARGRHAAPPAVCMRHDWSASAARHETLYREFAETFGWIADARDALPAALAG